MVSSEYNHRLVLFPKDLRILMKIKHAQKNTLYSPDALTAAFSWYPNRKSISKVRRRLHSEKYGTSTNGILTWNILNVKVIILERKLMFHSLLILVLGNTASVSRHFDRALNIGGISEKLVSFVMCRMFQKKNSYNLTNSCSNDLQF